MILAAPADGVHNVETGEVVLAGCDVGFFARCTTQAWAIVAGRSVMRDAGSGGGMVAVAAQHGFGFSRDGGDSWSWTTEGLHAPYLQCVALTEDAAYVGASSGPFAQDAAVYRASAPGSRFERRSNRLPDVFEAIG